MQALLPVHVMAVISTALLTAWAKLSVGVVAAFAAGLAIGLGALASGVGQTPAGDVLVVVALLCGIAAAAAVKAPAVIVGTVALVVGLALGLDSPPDAILLREAILGLIGTGCAAVALLTVAVGAATLLARPWNGIALRVAGSWIAATAILALALRWAP